MSTHLMTFLPLRMTCLRAVEIQARKISGRMGIEAERVKTGPGSTEFFVEPLSNGSRRQGACGRNSADTPGYPARTPVSSAQTTGNSFVFGAFLRAASSRECSQPGSSLVVDAALSGRFVKPGTTGGLHFAAGPRVMKLGYSYLDLVEGIVYPIRCQTAAQRKRLLLTRRPKFLGISSRKARQTKKHWPGHGRFV